MTGTPTYSNTIVDLIVSDSAVPILWNSRYQILLNNTAFLKQEVDTLKASGGVSDSMVGNRTVSTPTAPSGLGPGTLTQWFSWIVSRITAILGTPNWFDAVPTNLQTVQNHMNNQGAGVHGAASAATANKLVIRNSAGTAEFSAPTLATHPARKQELDAFADKIVTTRANFSATPTLTNSFGLNSGALTITRLSTGRFRIARSGTISLFLPFIVGSSKDFSYSIDTFGRDGVTSISDVEISVYNSSGALTDAINSANLLLVHP
jgi:hypothetical protein